MSPTFVVMEISNLFFQSTLIIYVTTWFDQLSMNDNLVNRLWKKIWMTSIDFECFCIHYLSFNVYSTDNKHGVQRQVRRCRRRICLYIISNISAKTQVFYYLVSDAKIFDIILGWPYFSVWDKTPRHTPTRVIIVYDQLQ